MKCLASVWYYSYNGIAADNVWSVFVCRHFTTFGLYFVASSLEKRFSLYGEHSLQNAVSLLDLISNKMVLLKPEVRSSMSY